MNSVLLQLVLTIGAAFLGAWLALMRFRTERWWERKAETYITLVEALHEMSMPTAEIFDAGFRGQDISPEVEKELWDSFKRAKRKVWMIADTADFVISSEVFNAIQEMGQGLSQANDAHDFYTHLDETGKAVDDCLIKVKKIGVQELRIPKDHVWPKRLQKMSIESIRKGLKIVKNKMNYKN